LPSKRTRQRGAGAHREDDARVVGTGGEREEEGALLREEVNGPAPGGGVQADVGDFGEPAGDRAVHRVEVRHLASGEEVAA
jgi:hypothetical protein